MDHDSLMEFLLFIQSAYIQVKMWRMSRENNNSWYKSKWKIEQKKSINHQGEREKEKSWNNITYFFKLYHKTYR